MRHLSLVVVAGLLWGCGDRLNTTTAPEAPPSSPAAAPTSVSQWNGNIELSSASPAGSCEAGYLESHSQSFALSASAEMNASEDRVSMVLTSYAGQRCTFTGTRSDGVLTLAASHETCEGWPLPQPAVGGIMSTCHTIAPWGEGPFWDQGELRAQIAGDDLNGNWVYDGYDPGSRSDDPRFVVPPTRFTVALHVHLESQ